MTKCPKCGEVNESGTTACQACGEHLSAAPPARSTSFGLGALFGGGDDGQPSAPAGGTLLGLPRVGSFEPPGAAANDSSSADKPRYNAPAGQLAPGPRATSFGLPALARDAAHADQPEEIRERPPQPRSTRLGIRPAEYASLRSMPRDAAAEPPQGVPVPKSTAGGFQKMAAGQGPTTQPVPKLGEEDVSNTEQTSDSGLFRMPSRRTLEIRAPRNTSVGMRNDAPNPFGDERPQTGRYTLHGFAISGDSPEGDRDNKSLRVAPQKHGTLLGMGAIKRDPVTGEILGAPGYTDLPDSSAPEPVRSARPRAVSSKTAKTASIKRGGGPKVAPPGLLQPRSRRKEPALPGALDVPSPRAPRPAPTPLPSAKVPAQMPELDLGELNEWLGADTAAELGLDLPADPPIAEPKTPQQSRRKSPKAGPTTPPAESFGEDFDSLFQGVLDTSMEALGETVADVSVPQSQSRRPTIPAFQAAEPVRAARASAADEDEAARSTQEVSSLAREPATDPDSTPATAVVKSARIMKPAKARRATRTHAEETNTPPLDLEAPSQVEEDEALGEVVPGSGIFRVERDDDGSGGDDVVGLESIAELVPTSGIFKPEHRSVESSDDERPSDAKLDLLGDLVEAQEAPEAAASADTPDASQATDRAEPSPTPAPLLEPTEASRPRTDAPELGGAPGALSPGLAISASTPSRSVYVSGPMRSVPGDTGYQIVGVLAGLALIGSSATDGFAFVADLGNVLPIDLAIRAFAPVAGLAILALSVLKVSPRLRALVMATCGLALVGLLVAHSPAGLGDLDAMPRRLLASLGFLLPVGLVWRARYTAALGARIAVAAGSLMLVSNYLLFDGLTGHSELLILRIINGFQTTDALMMVITGLMLLPLVIAAGSLTAFMSRNSGGFGHGWTLLLAIWLLVLPLLAGLSTQSSSGATTATLLTLLSYGLALSGSALAVGYGLGDFLGRVTNDD